MNLFEILNANAHLTPDEIVGKLDPASRWVRGADFTPQIHGNWYNKPCRVCTYTSYTGFNTMTTLYSFSWSLDSMRNSLSEYWFILEENYNGPNHYPAKPAEPSHP